MSRFFEKKVSKKNKNYLNEKINVFSCSISIRTVIMSSNIIIELSFYTYDTYKVLI